MKSSATKAVQEVLAEMKRADFLFTSLGCLKVDPLMKTRAAPSPIHARKPEADRSRPAPEGAVGDLNYSFLPKTGRRAENGIFFRRWAWRRPRRW